MNSYRYGIAVLNMLLLLIAGLLFVACSEQSTGPENDGNTDQSLSDRALPQLMISLDGETIVNEPKVPARLKILERGEVQQEVHIGIEYRGSTSQQLFDKKSYGVETWDASGEDLDIGLLGFPEEEDWVLYGPYSDITLIRNVFVYRLAAGMGHYAPRTTFVELHIDGEFLWLYVFMEKIKQDDVRLDLADLDPDENDSERVTGGYLLKIDKTAGEPGGDADYTEKLGFRSNYNVYGEAVSYEPYGPKQSEETYFLYEDPDPEAITPQQKEYISNYIHRFETALLNDVEALAGSTFRRSAHGTAGELTYTDFIDLDSFVDFFLINELAHNADAYRLSRFLYKDRGGKLNMGPVWDFNLSLGNEGNEYRRSPETWIYRYNEFIPNDLWLVHFWWPTLMQDPLFREKVKERWRELRPAPGAGRNWTSSSRISFSRSRMMVQ
ncbi:MAG: CotH kinase family protein [Balneolaceae bacterium]|nr:CotH kinase family protein [Balneolaceae bacterium]